MDLREIRYFIAKDSPRAAKVIGFRLTTATSQLRRFPYSGRETRGSTGSRELIVGSYRILYAVDGETIVILGIMHGARNVPDQ